LFSPLPSLSLSLSLSVHAVILSEAKDPDTLNATQTARPLFNHKPALAVAVVVALAFAVVLFLSYSERSSGPLYFVVAVACFTVVIACSSSRTIKNPIKNTCQAPNSFNSFKINNIRVA
jgi:protein-S-isoprenylcysteine O-methyltransferase Ste14